VAKKKSASGATPAVVALEKAGIAHTLHPYEHDPDSNLGYGLEAAAAIGVQPPQVFKTLCVHADGELAMAIVPVDAKLDLKAAASALGAKKAAMAPAAEAERATGYVVGGISPVGGRKQLPTVLDSSALGFDAVYVSGGRRGFDIGLAPGDLVAVTRARTAAIARRD
jgi:Cys-tRNA(Pro)/Cys-tRNA(Cys) deacylase